MRRPLLAALPVLATIAAYLAAIVAGNLITTHYGPTASIYVAFFAIGLDLTARDRLHDLWTRHRLLKLGALILAGSLLSYLLNPASAKIAQASAIAFAAAAAVDTIIYHVARRRHWLERVNASNIAAAAVDSLVFPTLAFGGVLWSITFGQFTAKVAGGLIWGMLLLAAHRRAAPAEA